MKYLIPLAIASLILVYALLNPAPATIEARSANPQFTTTDIQPAAQWSTYREYERKEQSNE